MLLSLSLMPFNIVYLKKSLLSASYIECLLYTEYPPSIIYWALSPNVIIFGGGVFGMYLKLDEIMRVGPWSTGISVLIRRDTKEFAPFPTLRKKKKEKKSKEGKDGARARVRKKGRQRNKEDWKKENHLRTQQEGWHMQARNTALTRNLTSQNLDLSLPSLQNCEK